MKKLNRVAIVAIIVVLVAIGSALAISGVKNGADSTDKAECSKIMDCDSGDCESGGCSTDDATITECPEAGCDKGECTGSNDQCDDAKKAECHGQKQSCSDTDSCDDSKKKHCSR